MLEKDIVNHVVKNWDTLFPDLIFVKTEYSLRNFRVDILAYKKGDRKHSVFIEVKHNSSQRDLIYEITKQIKFADWYNQFSRVSLYTLAEDYDSFIAEWLTDNNVKQYIYSYENELENFKIKENEECY